jgi:hypothetical protein
LDGIQAGEETMSNIQTVDHPNSEADNIRAAIQEDAAQQLLKFAKGTYSKKKGRGSGRDGICRLLPHVGKSVDQIHR